MIKTFNTAVPNIEVPPVTPTTGSNIGGTLVKLAIVGLLIYGAYKLVYIPYIKKKELNEE